MEIGLGLDSTLNLSLDEQNQLCETAVELGFNSIWTPEGTGQDSYQICLRRWEATTNITSAGITTGIAVSPVIWRSPMAFAMAGGTVSQITNGKFIMGLGSGGIYRPGAMNSLGKSKISALSLMRDYVTIVRKLVNGETVSYRGKTETLLEEKLAENIANGSITEEEAQSKRERFNQKLDRKVDKLGLEHFKSRHHVHHFKSFTIPCKPRLMTPEELESKMASALESGVIT